MNANFLHEMKLPISSNLTENRSNHWLNKMEQNHFPIVGFECDMLVV